MKNLNIWQLNNLSKVLIRLTLKNLKNYDDKFQEKISKIGKKIEELIESKFDNLTKEEQQQFIKEPMI